MIGVIGCNAFPACPSPWWNSDSLNDHLIHNIQHWNDGYMPTDHPNKKIIAKNKTLDLHNPHNEEKSKAVALDGLWMCAHRKVFEKYRFDDKTFKGFHCYDTDICLQINQDYDIYVVYDILIEHLSMGSVKADWASSAEMLADKWATHLPCFAKPVDNNLIDQYNTKCLLTYCYWIQSMGFSEKKIRAIIEKYKPSKPSLFFSKEYLLLCLWLKIGYKNSKMPYKILKLLATS